MSVALEVWSILTRQQRVRVLAAQAVSLLMALSTVTGMAAIVPFFAVLGDPLFIEHHPLLKWLYHEGGFDSRHTFAIALGAGFMAVVLVANLINLAGSVALDRLALRIGAQWQTRLFGEYLRRPYLFHARAGGTRLANNILYEVPRLTHGILENLFLLVTNSVTAAVIVVCLLLLNPALSAALLAGLGGGYLVTYLGLRNRLLRSGQELSRCGEKQARMLHEGLGAMKEVSLFHAHEFFRAGFESASAGAAAAAAHHHAAALSPKHLMECVAVGALVAVALFVTADGNVVGLWLGQLTFVAFAGYRLLPSLQQAFAALVKIRAARSVLAVLAPDLREASRTQCFPAVNTVVQDVDNPFRNSPRQEIQLRAVSFHYIPEGPPAINELSLTIAAGTAAAVVGANGSGKTTVLDLIAGVLVPSTGALEVDDTVIDDHNRPAWQARLAYVPQHPYLLDATIAENIAFGIPLEAIDRRRLLEASQLAQLDEFVRRLACGYDHRVGERGVTLSGGQRQQVGIARALYRNAAVLLLDEATNALDGLNEQDVITSLRNLRGRCTMILVAHRLSTVSWCDVIFELASGRLVASGRYDDLLRSSERFRRTAGLR